MKVGRILKLAGQNYINRLPAQYQSVAIDTLNAINAAAESFNQGQDDVTADGKLSPEGKIEARAKVAASTLSKLAAVEASIQTLTEREASLTAKLLAQVTYVPPKDPAERLAHELALQEVRSQLRELSAVERANLYRSTTDPLVIAAIDTAPATLSAARPDGSRKLEPFIDPDERKSAALVRAEAADQATAQQLRDIRALREVYTLALNGVRREMDDEVNQPV